VCIDYPDLDGDEARRAIWLVDVPLAATHHLRALINDGKPIAHEILEKYEIPIVASVLKLYFLELPDPVVSSHVYEIIKTIYNSTATDSSETTRVQVIQNTLGQLRLANIATLDAITTHFTRLIELTSADETYISALATNLAPCILQLMQVLQQHLLLAEVVALAPMSDLDGKRNRNDTKQSQQMCVMIAVVLRVPHQQAESSANAVLIE
jgi:hypothetical protein